MFSFSERVLQYSLANTRQEHMFKHKNTYVNKLYNYFTDVSDAARVRYYNWFKLATQQGMLFNYRGNHKIVTWAK